jgi:PAS domain S-box-containing protein
MYTLHVLIIEDSERDAELVIRQLKEAGYTIYHERIETADEMKVALEMLAWDIIIADYKLPQFNAPAALTVLKKTGLDIPFIVISGTIGEETVVELMKAGAHDYLMKNKLIRLVPAVKREIAEAQVRQERRQTAKALRASEERYRTLAEAAHDMIFIINRDDLVEYVNTSAAGLFHQRPEEIIGKTRASLFSPEVLREQQRSLQNVFETGMSKYAESKSTFKDQIFWLSTWLVPLLDDTGQVTAVMGVARDITNQKWLEEDKQKLLNKLQNALTQIKTLSGLLPICSVCKKIRDDEGYWQQVEGYIQNHTDVIFTHGVCPDCFPKLYPDFDASKPEEAEEQ